MNAISLKLMSPKTITEGVRKLLSELSLNEKDVVYLEFTKPKKFKPAPTECHLNVWVQCTKEGGAGVSGWMIAEDPKHHFVEAQYHTVWKSPSGKLIDITPRTDKEHKVLFVPDHARPISFREQDGNIVFIIYTNCKMQFKKIITGIERKAIVSTSSFALKHGFYKKG
jgi:hypothetical protein